GDAVVMYHDVGLEGWAAAAVDDGAALDHEVRLVLHVVAAATPVIAQALRRSRAGRERSMAQRSRREFAPVKVGWLGACLDGEGGGYDKIHRMAFDEAREVGVLSRAVEHVIHPENGLPNGSAK